MPKPTTPRSGWRRATGRARSQAAPAGWLEQSGSDPGRRGGDRSCGAGARRHPEGPPDGVEEPRQRVQQGRQRERRWRIRRLRGHGQRQQGAPGHQQLGVGRPEGRRSAGQDRLGRHLQLAGDLERAHAHRRRQAHVQVHVEGGEDHPQRRGDLRLRLVHPDGRGPARAEGAVVPARRPGPRRR
ncbi:MAG: hypothetical protein ACK559_24435, partial [bacterium]